MRPRLIARCLIPAVLLAALCSCGKSAPAAKYAAPPVDAVAYPQDTPAHTLTSIIAAMDKQNYAYMIAHLVDPNDAMAIIEKRGGLDKAVEFLADEKRSEKMKNSRDMMKKLLDGPAPVEGEENGAKFTRYQDGEKLLQLNQQPDGRWCMSTQVFKSKNAGSAQTHQTSGLKQ